MRLCYLWLPNVGMSLRRVRQRVRQPEGAAEHVTDLVVQAHRRLFQRKAGGVVTPTPLNGVPVQVETRVQVRASGRGREVDLGAVLVPGTKPVSLAADAVPSRLPCGLNCTATTWPSMSMTWTK